MAWWDQIISAIGGGGSAGGSSGGGFDWGDALNIGAQVLGPAIGASIANNGASDAADAQTGANREALGLQRDIYLDQTARSEPWRQSGFNALNFLNQWNGLPQVADGVRGGALGAGGTGQLDSQGRPLLGNLGAGQAVAGHTGGGGPNQTAQLVGSIAGNFIPGLGPIGGAIGGALGGLVRNGGDNWQTLQTQAPAGYDYGAYMEQNPGLAAEWAKPDVQSLFNGNRDAYADWHYKTFGPQGKNEGWVMNALPGAGGNTQTNQPVGGAENAGTATGAAGAATPDLWSTIRNNPLYVAAQDGFLGVNGQGGDVSAIKGAMANGGQLLSGSTLKALQDRSVSRAGGALSEIYGNYAGMAGVGASTANNQNANAGQFGANAGNLISQNGQIAGQAAAQKNGNWATAGQNAISGIYDYSKGKGWIN
jgi:hypothetical protein